jgi:hypothetical protein
MTTQTILTTLGAALLLVIVAFAVYAMRLPSVPNTGSDGSSTPAYVESVSAAAQKSVDNNENANSNHDDLNDPTPTDHSE